MKTILRFRFIPAVFLLLACVYVGAQPPSPELDAARRILRKASVSKDAAVRIQAIEAIGLIGVSDEVRNQLEEFLGDKNVAVRITAIKALADHKFNASIPALERILKTDKVPEVQFAAAKALYTLKDPEGRTWLISVCDRNEKAKSNLIAGQSRKFFGNFHSIESSGVFLVTQGIGYAPVPGVGAGFSVISNLIVDPDLSPRAVALMIVTRDTDSPIDNLLSEALKDNDWSVRTAAVQMIAFDGRSVLREELVPLFRDKNEKVRFHAAGTYIHLSSLSENGALPFGATRLDQ
jgi:HEAT repeat protein